MRVVIAPDKFAGTLSALEAAETVAAGWLDHAPADEVVSVPLSDGGTGFVAVLDQALRLPLPGREATEVELRVETVSGPDGSRVPAAWLLAGDVAYVESAQACGLHLVTPGTRSALTASTFGVGELLAAAIDCGARTVIIGLGGTATTDGGAGMLAGLAARRGLSVPEQLSGGGIALAELDETDDWGGVDVEALRALMSGVRLVAASDVDNPLTGLRGAAAVFGPQKGASDDDVQRLDAALSRWARCAERIPASAGRMRKPVAEHAGAGAGGGLGYALLLLGADLVSGIDTVVELVGLRDHIASADLVLTGEGRFDFQSLRGKVISGVAAVAGECARPCVVLAGQVELGRREMAAIGVEAAYAVCDVAGSAQAAMAAPTTHLRHLAQRVARTWSSRANPSTQ